uniref:RRM domain-containing protein n=1 Tax=Lotharella globosa TaxID=91324 RepID=A0A7S3Z4R6_9EUKA
MSAGPRAGPHGPPSSEGEQKSTNREEEVVKGTSGNKYCKIFVGGISWTTTDDGFERFFSKFGEVTDCIVMRDKVTRQSRGFGFVTFKEEKSVEKVLEKKLELDGRILDCKPAVPKDEIEQTGAPATQKTRKIFVGGIPQDCTEAAFEKFFGQFGTIVDAKIMTDGMTGRPRGFGFVTFDSEQPADKLSQMHHIELNGKQVEVKKAVPKARLDGRGGPPADRGGYTSSYAGGGRGGGGYSSGGYGAGGYSGYDHGRGGGRGYRGGYNADHDAGRYGRGYGGGYGRGRPKPNPEYTTYTTPAYQAGQGSSYPGYSAGAYPSGYAAGAYPPGGYPQGGPVNSGYSGDYGASGKFTWIRKHLVAE